MARHRGHGLLKAIRQVSQPDKHRVAAREVPRCAACSRRCDDLCPICIFCPGCCPQHDDEED